MDISRVLGIAALVVGAILLFFGLHSIQSVTEQVVEGVSGRYTDHTMWYIISGAVLLILGAAFTFKGCCKNDK